jgi:tetratricopeptide (TPR) repeat protein
MPKPKKPEKKKKPALAPKPGQSQVRLIEDSLRRKEYTQAARMAQEAMSRFPTNPEFPEMAAEALMEIGWKRDALVPARRLIDMDPNRIHSLHLAAVVYAQNGMFAHSARCIRRIAELNPNHASIERLRKLSETGENYIRTMAERLEATFEDTEEGSFLLEEANVHRDSENDYPAAIDALRQSAALLPKSTSVRNALAEELFLSGRLEEAESLSREVLSQDEKNAEAHLRLMFVARARYDDDALQTAYARVQTLEPGDRAGDLIFLAKAHGMMGDHEAAYAVARRVADVESPLSADALRTLGAAAANTGRIAEARGFFRLWMQKGVRFNLEMDTLGAGLPGPNFADSFPYFDDDELIHRSFYREIMAPIWTGLDEDEDRPPRVDLSASAERFPQLVWIGEKLLVEDDTQAGLGMLLSIGSERSVRIVRDLATGTDAPWYARITAATAMMDHGFLKDGETLRMSVGDGWREIGTEELRALFAEPEIPEDARAALEESTELFRDDPDRAERILRDLVARYPDLPPALNNLALLSLNKEEKESRLRRALELDPDYDYARATLASFLAGEGKPDEAEETLSTLSADHLFKPNDYLAYLFARAHIERARRNYDEAIALLRRALRENIFYEPAYDLLVRLQDAKASGRIDAGEATRSVLVPDRFLSRRSAL